MLTRERIAWGFLAGFAIVLVKILGPDEEYVKSFLISNANNAEGIKLAEILAYGFISIVTILLGGIAGAFTKENDKTRILLFAVSFPALLTTVTAQKREPIGLNIAQISEPQDYRHAENWLSQNWIISSAHAQEILGEVCVEESLTSKILQSTIKYISGSKSNEDTIYRLVIASKKDLAAAKEIANKISLKTEYSVSVGCKRPESSFFPVYIGDTKDQKNILEFKGEITAQKLLAPPDEPYVSAYKYSKEIYEAPKN